jgi:outer membrane protein OmpA-like peptidoglycan-associated protein
MESLGQLLVLVRFNEQNVEYQQPMYDAVSTTLDRKPDANFTVVAVTPKSDKPATDTDTAQRRADTVKSELVQLGLQPSRIGITSVSSEVATSPEVHVYVR